MRDYVFYCIPTYKSFEECKDAILALYRSTRIPDQIIVIDNSGTGEGTLALTPLANEHNNIYIWPQSYNLGVSKAWNLFHSELKRDFIIIGNDDVEVHPQTIERMVETAKAYDGSPMLYGDGHMGNAYSLFLYRHWAFQQYGGFDERFSPAYFEDNDMWYRLHVLAGHAPLFVDGATYDHAGSSTIKKYNDTEMSMHHSSFRSNEQYYLAKWGGAPHKERYLVPFNGEI